MSFLDKIERCNLRDLTGYRRFTVDGVGVGWLSPERADALKRYPKLFTRDAETIALASNLKTPAARSKAIAEIGAELADSGAFGKLQDEYYAVKNAWSEPELFELDRGLVPGFGVRAYGVHVNGFVRTSHGLSLWIGTRAMDRKVEPGKRDNMVAGGQPAGLTLMENLAKECDEEARIDLPLALTARLTGAITYSFNTATGVRDDTMFCFDLEMPPDVTPVNRDGEISRFDLVPLGDVLAEVRDTDRYKFNVNLVIIDFAIRHGVLTPENEPDYERIIARLRARY